MDKEMIKQLIRGLKDLHLGRKGQLAKTYLEGQIDALEWVIGTDKTIRTKPVKQETKDLLFEQSTNKERKEYKTPLNKGKKHPKIRLKRLIKWKK